MTRLLAFGDLHLGASRDHRVDSLADQERALQSLADIAHDNGVELIVNAGDTYDRPGASIAAQHVWRRFTRRLEQLGIPMLAILGNAGHDQVNAATATAVELEDERLVAVSRHPQVCTFENFLVCTLPSVPVHRLVAQHPDLGRVDVNELAARLLVVTARELHEEAVGRAAGRPIVLLAHWSIGGSSLPNGLPVAELGEPVLWGLDEIGFSAVIAGHIHKGGIFKETAVGPMLYVGSPMCLNFGEADVVHGCWLVERKTIRFVPLPDRRFVTVEVDLTGGGDWMQGQASDPPRLEGWSSAPDAELTVGAELSVSPGIAMTAAVSDPASNHLDPTDIVAAAIAEHLPLTDAVVRVRYRATEEQHRRVDHGALNRLLEDAGVHRVYGGIHWQPVYASRARVEGVDETLTPAALIRAWCEANEIPAEAEDALWSLTADYLQAVAA